MLAVLSRGGRRRPRTSSSGPSWPTPWAPTWSSPCTARPATRPRRSGVATYFYGHDRPGAWSAVGERLADLIRRELVARTGLVDCQSHPRTWDLLRRTSMPAVRLDVGYLSNADDARRLADPAFRDTVADSVVVGDPAALSPWNE